MDRKVLHASGFKILEMREPALRIVLWGFEDALHGTPSRDTNNGLRHNCFEINDISGCISSEKHYLITLIHYRRLSFTSHMNPIRLYSIKMKKLPG